MHLMYSILFKTAFSSFFTHFYFLWEAPPDKLAGASYYA